MTLQGDSDSITAADIKAREVHVVEIDGDQSWSYTRGGTTCVFERAGNSIHVEVMDVGYGGNPGVRMTLPAEVLESLKRWLV